MLSIVYPICCGMDIHKKFLIATIAITNSEGITEYIQKRFSTFKNELLKLRDWLDYHSCFDVCMESTGKYWIPIFNILEEQCNICLAHPKYVRAIKGKKTDKRDSKWIADLFKHDLVIGSFIPPLKIRQLRDLFRYRMKLTYIQTAEKNRYQNSLTWSNIQIANVVSDVFGKSSQAIIEELLNGSDIHEIPVAELVNKRMLDKVQDIKDSIDGEISEEQAEKIRIIKAHYDALEICKLDLDKMIREIAKDFEEEIKLIQTIPGFSNELSACRLISEIGVDMTVFGTARKLSSWAGLVPANNESAGKKFSTRISKGGHYLKPFLVQIANAVVRSQKHPELRNKYLLLKKRRGHKKAIIAIARKLLVSAFYVLKNKEDYNPDKLGATELQENDRIMTIKQAIKYTQLNGYKVVP